MLGVWTLVFTVALLSSPFGVVRAAVFKCVEGGKTIYQGTPCQGTGGAVTVEPANRSVEGDSAATATTSSEAPSTTTLRTKVDVMARERRLREINYQVEDSDREVSGYQQAMEIEMGRLERKKIYAKNNLAGATYEQSISTEMAAVADKYRVKVQISQDRAAALRKEAEGLRK